MNALLTAGFAEQLQRIIAAAGPDRGGDRPARRARGAPGPPARPGPGPAGRLPVHVTGDADAARCGAFLGRPGIVVIAGTGSVALGWDGERFAFAGGHGFLLGDEGSAYWIGREAVRAALRFHEQIGGTELIYRTVTQATVPDLDVLISEVNARPADRGLPCSRPRSRRWPGTTPKRSGSSGAPPSISPPSPSPSGAASARCPSRAPAGSSAPRPSGRASPS